MVFYLEPDTKVQQIFILPNIFSIFFQFFAKICGFGARFRPEPGIFAYDNPKNQSLCPLEKCPAATNGANPGKFTQPKHKRKRKAVQFTHPVTGKSPRKAKRNREQPDYPGNSLSLPCLFTNVSPTRYFDRRARETGCGFLSPVAQTTPFVPGHIIANLGLSFRRRKIRPTVCTSVRFPGPLERQCTPRSRNSRTNGKQAATGALIRNGRFRDRRGRRTRTPILCNRPISGPLFR